MTTIQILAFRARRHRDLAREAANQTLGKSLYIPGETALLYVACSDCELIYLAKTEVKSEVNLTRNQMDPKKLIHTYTTPNIFQLELIREITQLSQ